MKINFRASILPCISIAIITISLLSIHLSDRLILFDLISHFLLQISVLLLIISFVFIVLKQYKEALCVFAVLVYFSIRFIIPVQIQPVEKIDADIFFINSNYYNTEPSDIYEYIIEKSPETIVIVEANTQIIDLLSQEYGSPIAINGSDISTCVIFSNDKNLRSYKINTTTYPICYVENDEYAIIAIHPFPPLSSEGFNRQKEHFREVSKLISDIKSDGRNFVLVGDFNSTYYSNTYRKYFGSYKQSNIYTWRIGSPLSIPIDHAISNLEITVGRSRMLSSDHAGLLIQFD